MFEAIAEAMASALSIWDHKEKNKMRDQLIELRRAYYEEQNKDPADRDDAVIDRLEHELRLMVDTFAAYTGESSTTH